MQHIDWIEIDPLDTLFFGGTESMVAGENHEADTMFPPMPATLTGAVRSAILGQKGILPAEYLDEPEKWLARYSKVEKGGVSTVMEQAVGVGDPSPVSAGSVSKVPRQDLEAGDCDSSKG